MGPDGSLGRPPALRGVHVMPTASAIRSRMLVCLVVVACAAAFWAPEPAGGEPAQGEQAGESSSDTVAAVPETLGHSDLSVLRAYVCRGIEQNEPTEAGRSFIPAPDGVLHLCCFSEIGAPAGRDTIVHVWYWGQREMAKVRLGIRGPRWRTWSTKRILDDWRGEWHVDITDRHGVLLSRLPFSVE